MYWSPEVEHGNIEYKRQLINVPQVRIEKLTSQMKWRLNEGRGEAIYVIGIEDDGFLIGIPQKELIATQNILQKIAKTLSCKVTVISDISGQHGIVRKLLIRKTTDHTYINIRIAVCGSENSGKSTLIAVLNQNKLDNGHGSMRIHCFNHLHEMESGKTSSISHQLLGFDSKGKCVNDTHYEFDTISGETSLSTIVDKSHKIISFIDLPGFNNYSKTSLRGLTNNYPDYCLLVIDCITDSIIEYSKLINTLNIPIILVITKKDLINHTINVTAIKHIKSFYISSVTGDGLDEFKSYLNLLPQCNDWSHLDSHNREFIIEKKYFIDGVGTIVSGVLSSGKISINDELLLGPDNTGKFHKVKITSIYRNYKSVDFIRSGQFATCCLNNVHMEIRAGQVLLDKPMYSLTLQVLINTNKLKNKRILMQCHAIRQIVEVIKIHDNIITIKLLQRPEYFRKGMNVIFNNKFIGIITKL